MGHEGMRSSLASREAIADTVELTMRGHCYDAIVGLAGCDKSLPGMMMAMVRLNMPSVFIYGGSILPGRLDGKDVTVQDVFEAVGKHQAGNMSDAELEMLERVACPSAGACGGQFTANTMACVSEAIGLALMNSSGAPAPYEMPRPIWRGLRRSGDEPDRKEHPRPRYRHAQVAGKCGARRGLHRRVAPMRVCTCLPSPMRRASISTCSMSARFSATRPISSISSRAAQYVAKDLYEAGGVPVVLKELRKAGLIHEDCMTAIGPHHGRRTGHDQRRGRRQGDLSGRNPDHPDRRCCGPARATLPPKVRS